MPGLPNLLGVEPGAQARVDQAVPGAMVMGTTGMGEMTEHRMPAPRNSIPMLGGVGPFGTIDMGGMFTIVKVRAGLRGNQDPGWYQQPRGTAALKVPSMSAAPGAPAGHEGHSGGSGG